VLRSSPSRVNPGDTIVVRSYASSKEALAPGWIGIAYLNPDPKTHGPEARRQFIAADGDSLVENPPAPPSLRYWYTPKVGAPPSESPPPRALRDPGKRAPIFRES